MLDIKFVRENPDAVKENIKKKFQDAKLPLVDEVIEKDAKYRAALKEVEALKAARNKLKQGQRPAVRSAGRSAHRRGTEARAAGTDRRQQRRRSRLTLTDEELRRKRRNCLPAFRRSCTPFPR